MKELLKIAKVYGIKELIQVKSHDKLCQANGEDSYLNHSYLIGNYRIELGIYEDKELKIASFFHEIGHLHISGELINEPYEIEKRAWETGFEIAKINGYKFKPATHKWAKEQMLSYKSREIKKSYGAVCGD